MNDYFRRTHGRILRKFLLHDVDFVLIGGHAAIYHGVERTTSDLDILVRPTLQNGTKIFAACKDIGLDVSDLAPEDFTKSNVFCFGMIPNGVDILNYSVGISINDIFENAVEARIEGMILRIIDIRDLLVNKQSIKRSSDKNLVDQQDIIALKRIIDWKKKRK